MLRIYTIIFIKLNELLGVSENQGSFICFLKDLVDF